MTEDATSRSDADQAGDVRGPAGHDEIGSGPTADVDNGRIDDGRWADRGVVPRADNKTVWVLVADEALARILRWPETTATSSRTSRRSPTRRRTPARASSSATPPAAAPAARRRARAELAAAAAARQSSPVASAGEDDVHLEAQAFARRVAARLAEALQQKRFDELRIVAAPRFLGYLRKELDAHVKATVSDELSKDLIHEGNGALSKRLFGAEAGANGGK